MARPQGVCIFCGGTKLSKEHLFSRWMGDFLGTKTAMTSHQVSRTSIAHGSPGSARNPTAGLLAKTGDITSRKLKLVCVSCNNNWMSQRVKNAKDIVAELIQGHGLTLSPEQQRDLFQWLSLTACITDKADPLTSAVSPEQLKAIYEGVNDGTWAVYITRCPDPEDVYFYHRALSIVDAGEADPESPNTQMTFYAMGSLGALVCSTSHSTVGTIETLAVPSDMPLVRIYPNAAGTVLLPMATMSRADVGRMLIRMSSKFDNRGQPDHALAWLNG